MSNKKMIVKVQVPLFSTEVVAPVLVYNKNRSIQEMFPLTQDILDVMGGEKKKYFYAYVDDSKKLHLDVPAPWQDW